MLALGILWFLTGVPNGFRRQAGGRELASGVAGLPAGPGAATGSLDGDPQDFRSAHPAAADGGYARGPLSPGDPFEPAEHTYS